MWTITCFNGTVFCIHTTQNVIDAINLFKRHTGLHEMDIKSIINNH